ncbi:hypothetical protein TS70_03405 [Spiroplasma sp. hyd1]|nr:hypothetical protein [Spiroplasma sp. hyd1]
MNKNYYKILEISSTASAEEIKENFRRLAKKILSRYFEREKCWKQVSRNYWSIWNFIKS